MSVACECDTLLVTATYFLPYNDLSQAGCFLATARTLASGCLLATDSFWLRDASRRRPLSFPRGLDCL